MSLFDYDIDPVVRDKCDRVLDEEESRFILETATVMFLAWSGCYNVRGEQFKHDLDDLIIEQLRIMIWG